MSIIDEPRRPAPIAGVSPACLARSLWLGWAAPYDIRLLSAAAAPPSPPAATGDGEAAGGTRAFGIPQHRPSRARSAGALPRPPVAAARRPRQSAPAAQVRADPPGRDGVWRQPSGGATACHRPLGHGLLTRHA